MGSLLPLFLAVALLAGAQMGLGRGAPELPWMVGPLMAWPAFAAQMARRAVRAGGLASVRRWILVTEASGVAAYFVLIFGCDWLGSVRRWTGDPLLPESWPGLALGLALAPFIAFQLAAIDASVRAHGGTATTQRHLRGFQARMFLAAVAPIAAFVLASAAIARFPWLRAHVEHVGLMWTLFMVLFVGAMACVFPRVVRWAWDTEAFPEGPQRELLDDVARRSDFQPAALRIWRTGHLVANATIIGLTRRGRVVLLSDELLSVLNSRELSAVYAHEIGHAVRGHVGIFLAWTAGFFLIGDLVVARTLEGASLATGLALGAALAALWFVAFGWLSRRFELEADLFSFEIVGDLPALVSALERVGGADRTRNGWRHFSVKRRVQFLGRAASDARFVRGFRGRLRAMAGVGYTLAALGAVLQFASLAEDLPRDRAVAALSLGRFSAAEEHLEGAGDGERAELVELIEVGRAIDPAVPIETALTRALRDGSHPVARIVSLAQLAALRGVPYADEVADALREALEVDDMGVAEEIAEDMDGPLGEALRARTGSR
ncbi:MAG: M48 family metallopeptidase [Planctomycetota bacterium]|nr:M48 family metallopeptidase [Planctomycetota bacterium]